MDDPLLRLAVVSAAAGSVAFWAWWRRRRLTSRSWRAIPATGLEPGTYLFTSLTCGDCSVARDRFGQLPFTEITWEDRPEMFQELGINQVPSTLIVLDDGTGTWHRGVTGQVLKTRNP